MATITDGTVTITPDLVLGWDSTRDARTQVHPVLGRPDPEVTLRPAGTRTGTLVLFFTDLADAQAAEDAHATPGVWSMDNTTEGAPSLAAYVVSGPITLRAEGPNLDRWLVEVAYQEVVP